MSKKKKESLNINIRFSLLLLISLPLTLTVIYFFFQEIFNNPIQSKIQTRNIPVISKPEYQLTENIPDLDLSKLPSNYDQITDKLNIQLTQHEKTTLLLYGESIHKSESSNITEAYTKGLELDIPLLIPQEYINQYVNYCVNISTGIPTEYLNEMADPPKVQRSLFSTPYAEYIYNQMVIQLEQESTDTKIFKSTKDISSLDFLFEINNDSFNRGYYISKILHEFTKDECNLSGFFDTYIKYYESGYTQYKQELYPYIEKILLNGTLNKEGLTYWRMYVSNDRIYLAPVYIVQEYEIADTNFNDPYDITPVSQNSNTTRVPILMYHQIDAIPQGSTFIQGLYVTPEIFEEQLAYLVKKNYKSISPDELYTLLQNRQNPTQKSVMITFDDSKSSQYKYAYPLLKKYGLSAVFYIVTSKTGITYTQLKEMGMNGMIFGSHTSTHVDLTKETNSEKLYSEIVGSRYTLRNIVGQEISSISYPGCVIDSKGYPYVNRAGYLTGVSCGRSIDHTLSKRLTLSRVHVFNSLENLKNLLSGIN